MLKKRFVLVVSFLFFSNSLFAELIQWDAFDAGDKLAVKDVSTGLVWLDLDLTAGVHYDNAASLFTGWEYAGYGYVESLLEVTFFDLVISGENGEKYLYEQNCLNGTNCYSSARDWQMLFGVKAEFVAHQTRSFGLYKDEQGILRMGGSYLNGSEKANRYGVDYSNNYSAGYDEKYKEGKFFSYGTFLIKSDSLPIVAAQPFQISVNEPTSKYFFALMLGFVWMVKRKQSS